MSAPHLCIYELLLDVVSNTLLTTPCSTGSDCVMEQTEQFASPTHAMTGSLPDPTSKDTFIEGRVQAVRLKRRLLLTLWLVLVL